MGVYLKSAPHLIFSINFSTVGINIMVEVAKISAVYIKYTQPKVSAIPKVLML